MLRSEHLDLLEDVFANVCSDFGATLVESNGQDDHVHPPIEYPPTVAISTVAIATVVNSLKGGSSRNHQRRQFEMGTHRDHLWSPSYLAASAGRPPLSIIRQYVETQRRPA